MAFRGITFSKQSVSSNDDAHIYRTLLHGRKGRTKGCRMTHGTDDIYISEGYFFAPDRLIEISSSETIPTPGVTSGTSYCRLVFEIDMTKTNTNSEFNQGYFKILSSASGYPAITQEDLEDGGNVYQLPFAKFTKTISGIGSFVSELETIGYAAGDSTIYVSPSGNDASGDGSESYPYKTIQHAIDCAPKNLDGKTITINIAAGTYAEKVEIAGFYGGTLRVAVGNVTINTMTIYEANVIITGTKLTLSAGGNTYGFYVHRGGNAIVQCDLEVNGSSNGVYASYGSRFSGKNVAVNSCTYAVVSIYAAMVYIAALSGSKNNNAIQSAAAIASIGSIEAGMASTQYVTTTGGRIYTGAQASVPSY